jgi:energy-coupling factor transporter ATP-binding protein EcfA2
MTASTKQTRKPKTITASFDLLARSVYKNDLKNARLCLEAGISPNQPHTEDGDETLLIYAVHREQVEMVALLLSHGADAMFIRPDGMTALTYAAASTNNLVNIALLESIAGSLTCEQFLGLLAQKDEDGTTAIDYATESTAKDFLVNYAKFCREAIAKKSEKPVEPLPLPVANSSTSPVEIADLQSQVAALTARVQQAEESINVVRKVELVVTTPTTKVTLEEHVHPAFEKVMFHVGCGDNVLLVGPTGTGKTHLAAQVAKALNREFAFLSCSIGLTESSILGQREPSSDGSFTYRETAVVKSYEKGGVFLWDEVDAMDPNVGLVVNAAISNGHLAVPKRFENPIAVRHADFLCLCAANTYGTGADRKYVGRNQLDAAFLDRFTCITVGYDEALEAKLIANQDLLQWAKRVRSAIESNRLERNLSMRQLLKFDRWLSAGKDLRYVEGSYTEGWKPDEVRRVR